MAKDFKGKEDAELFRKIKSDDYMFFAVIESYETLKKIIYALLEDEADRRYTSIMLFFQWGFPYHIMHIEPCFINHLFFIFWTRVMNQVFLEVDMSIQQQRFIYEFRMSGLPLLSDKLEKFLSILVISEYLVHSLTSWGLTQELMLETFFCPHVLICKQLSNYEDQGTYKSQLINVFQDVIEIITQDLLVNGHE